MKFVNNHEREKKKTKKQPPKRLFYGILGCQKTGSKPAYYLIYFAAFLKAASKSAYSSYAGRLG